MTIQSKYASYFPGNNLLTPTIVNHGKQGHMVYELSKGKLFSGKTGYGVSVAEHDSGKRRYDLSKLTFSLKEAEEYIKTLKKEDIKDDSTEC